MKVLQSPKGKNLDIARILSKRKEKKEQDLCPVRSGALVTDAHNTREWKIEFAVGWSQNYAQVKDL